MKTPTSKQISQSAGHLLAANLKPSSRQILNGSIFATAAVSAIIGFSSNAAAQTSTGYKGNSGANWSTAGNWDNGAPVTNSNVRDLYFGQGYKAASGTNASANNDITSYQGYRITFQDSNAAGNGTDGSSANDTAFTITGNSFTLFDFGGALFPKIENLSFLTQTFSLTSGNTITLNGTNGGAKAEINAVNGNLVFSAGTKIDLAGTT